MLTAKQNQQLTRVGPGTPMGELFRRPIEDPPVIIKILTHLGLSTRAPPRSLRSDSIYSRRSDEPKTACHSEATAPLALSSSERRDPAHFARLRPLRRPSRPKQHRDFHQTERRLTSDRSRYCSGQKKSWFKIPIQLGTIYVEGEIPTVPTDIAPTTFADFTEQIVGSASLIDRRVHTEANWSKD